MQALQSDTNLSQGLGCAIRAEFPIYQRYPKMAYLDSAATSQRPGCVIERISNFLSFENANIHRGAYKLSANATKAYEQARKTVQSFLNAPSDSSIIFVRGTTEAVNLVARTFGETLKAGDCVMLTVLDHHSNIVPWQMLAKRRGIELVYVDCDQSGSFDLADFSAKLKKHKPKLVSCLWIANSIGTILPVEEIIKQSKASGAKVLIDAAQAVAHVEIDIKALDPDFLAFSGHKLYGPTGIGVLYGRQELLEELEPFHGGGDMIQLVSTEGSEYAPIPRKFEAGTPAIAEALGLAEAIKFVQGLGIKRIAEHEHKLFEYALEALRKESGVEIYGPAAKAGKAQAGIIAFNVVGVHAHDIATIADSFDVQLRGGHHCAMPLHKRLGINSSARVSFGVYSDLVDVERVIEVVRKAKGIFG